MRNRQFRCFLFICAQIFLVSSCMTSERQTEINKNLSEIQNQIERIKKQQASSSKQAENNASTNLEFQNTIDELKRQVKELTGMIDESKMRIKRIEQNSGATEVESPYMIPGGSNANIITQLQRQVGRLELTTHGKLSVARTGKMPPKIKSHKDLSAHFKTLYEEGNFKEILRLSTEVLNAAGATQEMLEVALDYRGEAKFMLQDYKGAAVDLSTFSEMFPKNTKVFRTYLLLGDSYVYLKNNFLAMSYYNECFRNFPSTQEGKACLERFNALERQLGIVQKTAGNEKNNQ